MKKYFAILASALTVFALASCGDKPVTPDTPDNPDPGKKDIPALTLSAANIDVTGIDGDYMAVVDNAAKTIKISLEYADKENAKALTISFVNIPQGFTTEYQKTFNYADGATQTVTFKYGEETAAEYVMSVLIGAADPKFLTLTVGGVNALSGEVRLSGATALSALAVEFTVDPAETQVTVNGNAVTSGDELDFSDKLNGVTFTLTCGEASNTLNVKVITSGIGKVTRVWGHYSNLEDDTWFQTEATDLEWGKKYWLRTCAMDDRYVYLAQHEGAATGAYVLSIEDGSIVGRLSVEGVSVGTHQLSAIKVIPDGTSTRILQCNLVAPGNLRVYSYADKDSKPVLELEYDSKGLRLGDKMGVFGTWQAGEITFVNNANNPRPAVKFLIENGKINPQPIEISLPDFSGSWSGLYKYSDSEELGVGCGMRPVVYSVSDNVYTTAASGDSDVFGGNAQGFNFFAFNNQDYTAFVEVNGNPTDGCLKIMPLNNDTLAESIKALTKDATASGIFKYGLGDPDEYPINGFAFANALGDCTVRQVGDDFYICAVSGAGAGVSLFKLEK